MRILIHPQLLVAPVPSVSHSTHMYTSCDSDTPLYTHVGINDLFDVKMALKNLNDWQSLGLALGLLYPTLKKIDEDQRGKTDKCVMEMIAAWLEKKDNVANKGVPSWLVLQEALRKIDENDLADKIIT